MAEFPALPFFTDAWVADTKHLSRVERDIYLHLLIVMWRTPGCKCPNDEAWLSRRLDIRENSETEILRRIVTEFCISDGNRIWQKRLLKEFQFCQKQSERRKGKKNKDIMFDRATLLDAAPTPTPTPTIKNTPSKPPKGAGVLNGHLEDFEIWYSAYPRKIARGAAERAFAKAIKIAKLDDLIAGAKRYAATVADSEPRFVAHPATWLNAKRWLDEQPAAAKSTAAAGVAVEPWEQRVKGFRKTGFWNPAWGFKPGQQGCSVPPQFLTEQERAAR